MKFESFQESGNEHLERSAEEQKVYSNMVRSLMYDRVRELGLAPDDDITPILTEWVDKQDEQFETIFNGLLEDDPNLVESWNEHPDRVMEEARKRFNEVRIDRLDDEADIEPLRKAA